MPNLNQFLLLILSFHMYNVYLYECPTIKCNPTENQLVNETCFSFFYSDSTPKIELKTCVKGQFCNIPKLNIKEIVNLKDSIKCSNYTLDYWSNMKPGKLVEKDYCYLNSDCFSKLCRNNECVGKEIGSRCYYDHECHNNQFCNKTSKECSKKVKIGDECLSNKMCPNDAGCLYGFCTAYNSLVDGTRILNENLAIYCESGYVNGETGICEGLINLGNAPHLCDEKSTCSYLTSISKKTIVRDSCLCDLSGNPISYCMLSTDSIQYKSFIKAKRELISSSNMCNYQQEMGCYSASENLYGNYLYGYLNLYQSLNNYTIELLPCLSKEIPQVNPAQCNIFPCENNPINDQVYKDVFLNNTNTSFQVISKYLIIISIILLLL